MSRRNRQNNSVSLFPFLAVLLCAMGALLVLLVITTRQIRDDAIRQAEQKRSARQKELEVVEEWPDWQIALGDSAGLPVKQFPAPEPAPLVAPKPIFIERETPSLPPDLSDEIVILKRQLARTALSEAGTERSLRKLEAETDAIQEEIDRRNTILKNAANALKDFESESRELSTKIGNLRERIDANNKTLQSQRLQNQKLAAAPRMTPNVLKVVPYDGRQGTTRRPILIECSGNIIRFVPEGIELSEKDLVGFSFKDNPLLSAIEAAEDYWMKRDQVVADLNRPYVLIIVRPDGIPAYYGARQLLQNYQQRFGYELVDQDQQLAYPEIDPQAKLVIETAVKQQLLERGTPPAVAARLFPQYDPRELEQKLAGSTGFGSPTLNSSGTGLPGGSHNTGSTNAQSNSSGTGGSRRFKFVQTSQGLIKVPLNDEELKSYADSQSASQNNSMRGTIENGATRSGGGSETSGPAKPKLLTPGIAENQSQRIQSFAPQSETPTNEQKISQSGTADEANENASNTKSLPGFSSDNSANAQTERNPAFAPDALTRFQQQKKIASSAGTGTGQAVSQPTNSPATPGQGGSQQSGTPSRIGSGTPGHFTPARKSPFERPLKVVITDRDIRIDDRNPVSLPQNAQTRQIMTVTVNELRARVQEWPAPPEQYYWKPTVRFYVYPEGRQNYERLKPYFAKQGLISDVQYLGSPPSTEGSRN